MKRLLSVLILLAMLCTMLFSLSGCKMIKRMFKTFKINDVSVKKYSIVCDMESLDYNVRAAEYIRDSILEVTGRELKILDDSEAEGKHEIVVGETSRQISKDLEADTKGVQFAMLSNGESVALEGDYFVIAAAAYYFADTYVNGKDVDLPDGVTVKEPITKEAKNYILLIGDGMGLYQTKLFEYMTNSSDFSDGESEFYGYMLPYLSYSRTDSYSGITDSAAGGTALATGYKTYNSYVGLDKDGKEIKSLTELAAELGKATAVLSTDKDTGATPASFSSHTLSRDNTTDILIGQNSLKEKYNTIIKCVNRSNCNKNSLTDIEADITSTLRELGKDKDGFFVMYEEAHIDKKSHNNNIDETFLALIRFNQAIALFMEYAFYNPDTVVIITADHETGGLLPGTDGKLAYTTENHTDADVPVFAYGNGTEFFNDKIVENTEIAKFFASLMGVDNFGDTANGEQGSNPDVDNGNNGGNTLPDYGDENELPIIPLD